MYLTDRHNNANRPIEDHQTAELLLEYCRSPPVLFKNAY